MFSGAFRTATGGTFNPLYAFVSQMVQITQMTTLALAITFRTLIVLISRMAGR